MAASRETLAMARYHHNVYTNSARSCYCVIFDLQWKIIECMKLEPFCDLRNAMSTMLVRQTQEGWQPEGTADFGFVFLNRQGIRRLLILTQRDPFDTTPQTFSPFK